jgi:DNA-binding NarL/FixJ family response regulator
MGISYQTLCAHRKELYRRLNVHSEMEAARVYAEMNKESRK